MDAYSVIEKAIAHGGFKVEDEMNVDHPPIFHLTKQRQLKDMKYEVVERRRDSNIRVINFTVETDLVKGFGQMELSQDSIYMFDGDVDHIEWIVEEEVVYPVVHTSEGQAFPKMKYEQF